MLKFVSRDFKNLSLVGTKLQFRFLAESNRHAKIDFSGVRELSTAIPQFRIFSRILSLLDQYLTLLRMVD